MDKLSYCKYCKLSKHQCQCTSGEWSADYKSVAGKLEGMKTKEVKCLKCIRKFSMPETFMGTIICENCDPFMNPSVHQHKFVIEKLAGFIKTGVEGVYIICRSCGEVRLMEVLPPSNKRK